MAVENLEGEIWAEIKDWPTYQISNRERVKSIERLVVRTGAKKPRYWPEKIRKTHPNSLGYITASLKSRKRVTLIHVHRLMAFAFIPNPLNKPCVNHIDGNPSNNRLENLEWVTHKENTIHAKNVTKTLCVGERNHLSVLRENEVLEIRSLRTYGATMQAIADAYGITKSGVFDIVKGNSWRHLLPT